MFKEKFRHRNFKTESLGTQVKLFFSKRSFIAGYDVELRHGGGLDPVPGLELEHAVLLPVPDLNMEHEVNTKSIPKLGIELT